MLFGQGGNTGAVFCRLRFGRGGGSGLLRLDCRNRCRFSTDSGFFGAISGCFGTSGGILLAFCTAYSGILCLLCRHVGGGSGGHRRIRFFGGGNACCLRQLPLGLHLG